MQQKIKILVIIFLFLSLSFFSLSSAAVQPDAHFSFDGHLEDESGNFAAGEVIGARLGDSEGVIGEDIFLEEDLEFKQGISSQAAYFNGQQGVLLPENLIENDSYTVSLWLKPEQKTQHTTSFFAAAAGNQWLSLLPGGNSAHSDQLMLWSGTDWYDASTDLKIVNNNWYHTAFRVDEGEVEVFVNGEKMFSGDNFPQIFADNETVYALGVNWWDEPYLGLIDELKIYNQTLSDPEIRNLAQGAPELITEEAEEGKYYLPDQSEAVHVHDPMIIKADDGSYYIFGSHLAAARSDNLINWEQIAGDWNPDNPIIPDPENELKEALEWPEPDNAESTWAKSPIKIGDKYYLYFSSSTWGATRSAIAVAEADSPAGPYQYKDMVIKSFNDGESNIEGNSHNPRQDPNAIDPHVFFDAEDRLWMLYGSYAGGIYIIEMDPETLMPKDPNSYGEKLSGGDHSSMEGAYIQYNPETEYYYYMVSYGSLASDAGYNIRLARSQNPDGPYLDPAGNDIIDAAPRIGQNRAEIGARIIGNFWLEESEIGYLSPGHNSALYDEELGKIFVVMHSRFPGTGEMHNVRVHQMLMNSEGWPLIMPHRYTGEKQKDTYSVEEVTGNYQYINHGLAVNADINESEAVTFKENGEIEGAVTGSWEIIEDNKISLQIEGEEYSGVLLKQWDEGLEKEVMTFSALSDKNEVIWGSQY